MGEKIFTEGGFRDELYTRSKAVSTQRVLVYSVGCGCWGRDRESEERGEECSYIEGKRFSEGYKKEPPINQPINFSDFKRVTSVDRSTFRVHMYPCFSGQRWYGKEQKNRSTRMKGNKDQSERDRFSVLLFGGKVTAFWGFPSVNKSIRVQSKLDQNLALYDLTRGIASGSR